MLSNTTELDTDWDNDGIPDSAERFYGLNDRDDDDGSSDLDSDGVPNYWEFQFGFNLADGLTGAQDNDGDGLQNTAEYEEGTNPWLVDSDGDREPDGEEVAQETDPNNKLSNLGGYGGAPPVSLTMPTGLPLTTPVTGGNPVAGNPVITTPTIPEIPSGGEDGDVRMQFQMNFVNSGDWTGVADLSDWREEWNSDFTEVSYSLEGEVLVSEQEVYTFSYNSDAWGEFRWEDSLAFNTRLGEIGELDTWFDGEGWGQFTWYNKNDTNYTPTSPAGDTGQTYTVGGWQKTATYMNVRLTRNGAETDISKAVTRTYLKVTETDYDDANVPDKVEGEAVTITIPVNKRNSSAVALHPAGVMNAKVDQYLVAVEIGGRDKYLGGSFNIPSGWETLEMEFVNKTSGENLGRYGDLDGSGSTRIYHSVTAPLGDSEETAAASQSESQKVWFVKTESEGPLQFFTCFNDTGEVEVRLYLHGTKVGEITRTLTPATDFANTIQSVDNWVKGYGFEFEDTSVPPLAFFAGNGGSAPSPSPISNYTRAALMPFYLVASQVEGFTEFVGGAADGMYAGLKDDVELFKLVAAGAVAMEASAREALESEVQKWRTDPYKRARELKSMTEMLAEECVFRPLKEKASDLKKELADWPSFVWKSITIWTQPNDSSGGSWVLTKDIWSETVKGVTSWVNDFGSRMMAGAESQHWLDEPWGEDTLVADFLGTQRVIVYTLGYDVGYILEQVAIGKSLGVAGKALAKGGVNLASQLSAKKLFTVAARGHVLKRLTTGVLTKDVRYVLSANWRALQESL